MTARPGGAGLHGRGLQISLALTAASVGWLAWLLVGPQGDASLFRVLSAVTAFSGSALLLLHPALAVFWFTFWPCVSAGAHLPERAGAAVTGGSVVILAAGYLDHRGTVLAGFAAVTLIGYVLGRNRKLHIDAARGATLAADERERAAMLAERARIARELHDVLAHSLTGVSLQIESAAAALEAGEDTGRALEHLSRAGQLVRTGRQEAVAAVRTLREGEVALHTMIEELIDTHRGRAYAARFSVAGTPGPLDGAAALALYRVVQEALTNAARHAPGKDVRVDLAYAEGEIAVRVGNATSPAASGAAGGGHGLLGMGERMAAVGGTLTAGRIDGRWRVEARVPVRATVRAGA
ncbi:sensor histidine kinase [Streptacidiphilus griseoplanus]|uniref:sensor histidine kinase n=1 Tax=Peterkaempfera griseoplana TaxID=66896 RepID=UPI0014706D5F|nr:sensor histidine kinase [Peterkaempfera griseoplana]